MSTPANPLAGAMAKHGGVAPLGLLDLLTLDGYSYHFATRPIPSAVALGIPVPLTGGIPPWNAYLRIAEWDDNYFPWLLTAGPFHLARSMVADTGSFVVQNVSGNSLQRDVGQMITAMAFEGARFIYREWNVDAAVVEFEMHGRLTVEAVTETEAEFASDQLFNPSDYQALETVSETCMWRYASAACGDATNNPCMNSWLTCRQPARFGGVVVTLININPGSSANVSARNVVRERQV
jgi:hypothetical protein